MNKALCSVVAIVGLSPLAGANLIANGGFEAGAVPGSPIGHAYSPAPWTSSQPGNAFVNYDTWENTGTTGMAPVNYSVFTGVTAAEGVRWGGGWNFEEMGQILGTTLTPGQQYTISALVRPRNGDTGSFQFYLGTAVNAQTASLATFPVTSSTAGWVLQSANFIAPAGAGSMPWFIIDSYNTTGTDRYIGIDDIRLVATPTPGALALLGAGGLIATRRRRG